MNFTAIFALTFGIILVFASEKFDGGSLRMLIQPVAFCIVIGGSFCASLLEEIIQIAYFSRRNGLLAVQEFLNQVSNPFLARGMQLAIDVDNPTLVYDILSAEIAYEEEEEIISSRVFEALGGYAPTFGVVGAVIGLIQVMQDIQNLQMVGVGIATAFVATLYGVGFANLIFLPIAGNLKQKTRDKILLKELVLQGIISIQMQENPAVIEEKLVAYYRFHHKTLRTGARA